MKIYLTTIILGLFVTLQAQNNLKDYHYSAYGFQKAVKEANYISYTFEDKFVEESTKESFKFNDKGYIVESVFSMMGAYNSDATTTYTYDNDKLVSKNVNVKQFPNFNTETIYSYDEGGRLTYIIAKGVYGNELKNIYGKKNQLETQLGSYSNSNSIEKYFYNNNELFKTVKNFYHADTITNTDQKLYQNGREIVNNPGYYIDVYLKDKKGEQTIRVSAEDKNLTQQFAEIEEFLKKNKENETFNQFIVNYPNSEVISRTVFKYNANKDWIACKQDNDEIFISTFYKFQEIKYLDETVSGSTEFNFFDVNELKNK